METLKELHASAKSMDAEKARAELNSAEDRLLACESEAKAAINKRRAELMVNVGKPELDRKYPRIDLDAALRSSKRQRGIPFPVPRFAAFPIGQPHCEIGVSKDDVTRGTRHEIPNGLVSSYSAYTDVMDKRVSGRLLRLEWGSRVGTLAAIVGAEYWAISAFSAQSYHWWHVVACVVASTFALGWMLGMIALMDGGSTPWKDASCSIKLRLGGALPDAVREKIKAAKQEFENVYVVAEAGEWAFAENVKFEPGRMADPDPLVIGKSNGAYYLIDKFDLTPVENWLAAEFAGKPPVDNSRFL